MNPSIAAPVTSASAHLRQACWPAHQALEATALSQAWVSDRLSLSQYLDGLPIWALAWSELERELSQVFHAAACPLALRPGPRAHLLRQDFEALAPGAEWPVSSASADTRLWETGWRALTPRAQTLALCYVMTGSAMGNRVVASHLHRHLGLTPAHGASFFAHTGFESDQAIRVFWSEWKLQFDQELQDAADWPMVAQAAVQVFENLTERFKLWPH